jgi:hypothetical protein
MIFRSDGRCRLSSHGLGILKVWFVLVFEFSRQKYEGAKTGRGTCIKECEAGMLSTLCSPKAVHASLVPPLHFPFVHIGHILPDFSARKNVLCQEHASVVNFIIALKFPLLSIYRGK